MGSVPCLVWASSLIPLTALVSELLLGNPFAGMQAGVLLLLLTPPVRIVVGGASFLRERDYLYMGVSFPVLAINLTSLALTFAR